MTTNFQILEPLEGMEYSFISEEQFIRLDKVLEALPSTKKYLPEALYMSVDSRKGKYFIDVWDGDDILLEEDEGHTWVRVI